MGGSVLFQDALAERLDIIRPSRADLDTFLRDHPFHLTKGVEDFVSALHAKGKKVYLVSGGFRQVRFVFVLFEACESSLTSLTLSLVSCSSEDDRARRRQTQHPPSSDICQQFAI